MRHVVRDNHPRRTEREVVRLSVQHIRSISMRLQPFYDHIPALCHIRSAITDVQLIAASRPQSLHITPLLHQLHWLKVPERIAFKCSVLVYKCRHGSAPSCVIDELCQLADVEARQRLRSSSSSSLIVSRTRLSTVGDRAFPVAAARVWNSLCLNTSLPHLRCLSSSPVYLFSFHHFLSPASMHLYMYAVMYSDTLTLSRRRGQ